MNEDIVLVTRVRIFCTTLFTNNNIKIVIKSSTFLDHQPSTTILEINIFIPSGMKKCFSFLSSYRYLSHLYCGRHGDLPYKGHKKGEILLTGVKEVKYIFHQLQICEIKFN